MKMSTNNGPLRVALYLRVSTDEQAKSGYSIPDQLTTLKAHAEREGWHVVEVITDDGYSGATPDRPGIRRIYELAEVGKLDLVLATKRDRFHRSLRNRLNMDEDLKDNSVLLVSLTDTGNFMGDSVMDAFAEWEREQTVERTRNGKLEKARQGKIIGANNPAFGYHYVRGPHRGKQTVVGYEVDETEMATVRRIFSEVASGTPIKTLTDTLDDEHVLTPKSSTIWSRPSVRNMIRSDLYKPHTVEELRALGVSEEVISKLGADEPHGVYRYEGIPVPTIDAGIPLGVVLEARRKLEANHPPSKNAGRFWELSGGILRCSERGRAMQPHTPKRVHSYYRDQGVTNAKHDSCRKRKMVRADKIEDEVWEIVRGIMDSKHYVLDELEKYYRQRRHDLHRPGADTTSLLKRRDQIEKRWAKVKLAYEADALTIADLKARRTELDAERDSTERELQRASNRDGELKKLDVEETEARARIEAGYGDLSDTTPENRRKVYEDLRLRVEVGPDKVPHVSGTFPVGRYGDSADTLVTTPDQRGWVVTTSNNPNDDYPPDGPRHAVYANLGGRGVGTKKSRFAPPTTAPTRRSGST